MEILNKNGMILMDYRREFKRHYADSVDEALKDAILTLYKEGQIPEKLFRIILDDKIEDSVVYTYLLSRREFTKSSMELNSEFNEVREKVNDYLIKINFVKNVCTKNSVNTNRIYVIKQYDIPKELLLSYFGLTPSEIIPLMKRKGFMDKFCVLRLSQAFKEIYSELKVPEHIDHGYSLIYYNKMIQGFSIDYKYMVSVNYINDEERLADLMNKIKDLDAIVEQKFESKMSYSYFHQLNQKMNMSELQAEIEKIVVPVRSGKRSQDIRRPELIVDETDIVTEPKKTESVVKPEVVSEKKPEVKPDSKPQEPKAPILVIDDFDDEEDSSPIKPEQENVKKPEVKKPEAPPVKKEDVVKPKVENEKKPDVKVEPSKPEATKPEVKSSQPQKQNGEQNKNNNNQGGNKPKQPQNNNNNNNNKPSNQNNKPGNNPPKQDNKNQNKPPVKKDEPVKQKPVDNGHANPKPVPKPKDDDDFMGEGAAGGKKPEVKQDKKPSNPPASPILVIDDSDLDMI